MCRNYINQDGGWSGIWHTFSELSTFRNPAKAVIEYFTQVVPPKFYVAKADYETEQRSLLSVDADIRILNRTRERLSKSLTIAGPQLNSASFEAEISEIVRQLTALNAQQELYRAESVSLQESLATADHQIAITTDALKRYNQDFSYLAKPSHDELEDSELETTRSEHLTKKHKLEQDMNALRSLKRRKAIKAAFHEHYKSARTKLNLNPRDVSKMHVSSRPDISGSGGSSRSSGIFRCPLVGQPFP